MLNAWISKGSSSISWILSSLSQLQEPSSTNSGSSTLDPVYFLLVAAVSWFALLTIASTRWISVKNPQIGPGYAMFRTTKMNLLLDRIAGLNKKFWKVIFDIGIVTSLGFLIIGLIVFSLNLLLFMMPSTSAPAAVVPIIPGITISFSSLPYIIIAIVLGAGIHEVGHGIAARTENISLKSTGIFIFLIFFSAFVEPDEKSLNSASHRSKQRVMAAGALGNIFLAIIFLSLVLSPFLFRVSISPLFQTEPSGALITHTVPGSPADNAGIREGWAMVGIAIQSKNFDINNPDDFFAISNSSILPNEDVILYFRYHDPVTLTTEFRPDETPENATRGFIGVAVWDFYEPRLGIIPTTIPYHFLISSVYISGLSLMLGLMNLFPIPPLDGDKLLASLIQSKNLQETKILPTARFLALIILLANLVFTFLFFGWTPVI